MASLTPCLSCDKPLSVSAKSCPSCKKSDPTGIPCQICGGLLKRESAICLHLHYKYGDFLFHKDCLEKHFNDASIFRCTICKTSLTGEKIVSLTCPSCGHPEPIFQDPWVNCHNCRLPFHPSRHEKVKGMTSDGDGDFGFPINYHTFCCASRNPYHLENIKRWRKYRLHEIKRWIKLCFYFALFLGICFTIWLYTLI